MFGQRLEMGLNGIYSEVPKVPVLGTETSSPPRSNG